MQYTSIEVGSKLCSNCEGTLCSVHLDQDSRFGTKILPQYSIMLFLSLFAPPSQLWVMV